MPSFVKYVVFLTLAVAANALTTPFLLRGMHHHRRAVTAHPVVVPMEEIPIHSTEPVIDIPERSESDKVHVLRRRRSNKGRCSQKSSGASNYPSSLLNSPEAKATPTEKSEAPSITHTSATTPSAAKSQSKLPSFMSGIHTGQATYYGTGLGSCGITNADSDMIVAVSHLIYDVYPGYNGVNSNDNPICGKQIKANYQGKSVTVTVTDRCTACKITDLDFSPSAFSDLADQALGRLYGMTWEWA